MQSLYDFMIRRGTPIQSTPFIGSRQIDLFALYVTVMKESGFQAATNKGAWGRVAVQNNLPSGDTALANQLAELYKVYLLPFEEAFQKAQAARRQQLASNQGRPPVQPNNLNNLYNHKCNLLRILLNNLINLLRFSLIKHHIKRLFNHRIRRHKPCIHIIYNK